MPRTIVAARLKRVCMGMLVCGMLVGCLEKGKTSSKGKSYFDNNATAGKPTNPWTSTTPPATNTTPPRSPERSTAFNPGPGSVPTAGTGLSNPPMESPIRRTEATMNAGGQFLERNPATFNGPHTPGLTAPTGQGPSAPFSPTSNTRTGLNINTFDPAPPGPRGGGPMPPPPPQPAIMGAEEPFRSNGTAVFQPTEPTHPYTPPPAPNPGGFVAPGPN